MALVHIDVRSCRAGGFTLIELIIVLVVIAILALLAMPSMTEQLVRQQVVQSLSLATLAENPVAAQWQATRTFPPDNAAAGIPVPGKIVSATVSAVTIQEGAVTITFGNSANALIRGKLLTLRPAVMADAPIVPVTWVCSTGPVPGGMSLQGVDQTNIPSTLLPISCRSPS